MQAIDHIDIRYRRADTVGDWTTFSLQNGQSTGRMPNAQRGETYQIEARAVGKNGAASIWVQQTHTVADATAVPFAPSGLTALSVADGVHLAWSVGGTQRADVEYDVERTNDISGSPNASGWVNIANIKATAYTDGLTDGVVRWYRVRAVDFQANASAYSNDVNSQNKSVADGADKTADQPIVYAGLSGNLIPNGDFLLQNISGWKNLQNGPATYDAADKAIFLPAGCGVASHAFGTTPGQKYRFIWLGWAGSGTQSTYLRVYGASVYADNLNDRDGTSTYTLDFIQGGSIAGTVTQYTYDWVCPAGIKYASLAMFTNGTAALAFSLASAQDFGAALEWPIGAGQGTAGSIAGQGALATLNQANTVDIVAGAVNSNIVYQSSTQVIVASDGAEHILGQVTISTNGGYVKVGVTLNVAAGANTHNLVISLRKGGSTGSIVDQMSDVAITDAPAGSVSVSLQAVDASAASSQQYTVTANAGFSVTCYCNRIALIVENAKV